MTQTISEYLCDFSFGMLFSAQIICTGFMYFKGRTHSLQKAVFVFMAYLLAISAFELVYFLFIQHRDGFPLLTSPLTDILEMTVIPAALLLVRRMVEPERKIAGLLAANALVYGAGFVSYWTLNDERIYRFMMIFSILYSIGIIVYGSIATRRYNQLLKNNFSDDGLSLYWLKYILYCYAAIISIWVWASLSGVPYAVALYNVGMMVLFGLICYFSYRQDDMLDALKKLSSEDKSKALSSKDQGFAADLERLFRDKEIYLDPKLTIGDLAKALGTNRTYASHFLNYEMHTNFYEYVNGWRVEKSKELLASTTLPLESVAEKSGFNSISSFRRYFTDTCGITPSSYRKLHREPK